MLWVMYRAINIKQEKRSVTRSLGPLLSLDSSLSEQFEQQLCNVTWPAFPRTTIISCRLQRLDHSLVACDRQTDGHTDMALPRDTCITRRTTKQSTLNTLSPTNWWPLRSSVPCTLCFVLAKPNSFLSVITSVYVERTGPVAEQFSIVKNQMM